MVKKSEDGAAAHESESVSKGNMPDMACDNKSLWQQLAEKEQALQALQDEVRHLRSLTAVSGSGVGDGPHFLNAVVENMPVAVYLLCVSDDFRVVSWNKNSETLFGIKRDDALGCRPDELWPEEDAGLMRAANLELVTTGVAREFADLLHPTRNRSPIRVRLQKIPLRDAAGTVSHILCTAEDMTERLEKEARLRRGEARYRAVVAAMGEAIMVRDAEGRIIDCNRSAQRILGKTLEQMQGTVVAVPEWHMLREDGSMMPLEEQPSVMARRTGLPQSDVAVCYRKPDGTDLWALINVQPLFEDDSKTPSGFVSSLTDISKRKLAELEIVRLNIDLENRVSRRTAQLLAANRELEAFSYSVAHDLRSPLGTIDGFCALLQKALPADAAPRMQHYLARIRGGVSSMGELTNGLLSLAKLSRTSLNWEAVDLSADAAKIVNELSEKDSTRVAQIHIEPGLLVRADRSLLNQVLQNLIANAWKFSSKKPDTDIRIGRLPGGDQAVFFVRDKGAGFDMAYADKLFGTFQRLHSPQEFIGSGIGLATVERIIVRHGGKIWAESVLGEGSTFFFTLGGEPEKLASDELKPFDEKIGITASPAAGVADVFGKWTAVTPADDIHKTISSDNDAFYAGDRQFSNAFEHSPIGMALVGLDLRRLRVNSAFCRMLGYSEAEMLARTVLDVTHPDDVHWDLSQRQRALAGEIETYQWEKRYIHQTGRTVWAFLTCSLVRDADRKPLHFISQILDITERKQIEQTLRESEERFRALTALSSDWYWEQDEQFRFVQVSIQGRADDESGNSLSRFLMGKKPWELQYNNMDEQAWADHKAMHESHQPFKNLEMTRLGKDGALHYFSISALPIFDATGRFTGYRGVGRNVTDIRRMTEALRKSEAQLRQITDTVPAMIAYVDSGHRFRFHNRAYEEVFGLLHTEIDGKHMRDVLGAELYEKLRDKVDDVLSGYPVSYQRTQKTARGDYRDYAVNYFPRYGDGDEDGQVIGFYSLATDITEIRRIDRMKSEFIATVSHEVRPLLSSIRNSLDRICLSPAPLPAAIRAAADEAQNDCERLIRLIKDMVEVEKIRSGKAAASFD